MQRSPQALVGAILPGGYRIVQHLGSGGVGHVYVAALDVWGSAGGQRGVEDGGEDRLGGPDLRKRVAIKVLRAELAARVELVTRFEREALAASLVRHPNVLQVFASGHIQDEKAHEPDKSAPDRPGYLRGRRARGVPFFAMELLLGLDLANTLASRRPLAPRRAARIGRDIAAGLAAAHRVGVIHRDLSPENVFLVHAADGREFVKVIDFGLAYVPANARELADAGVGTPGYVAPEQAAGAPPEPAADIYSLGVILHEMLTGHLPFEARSLSPGGEAARAPGIPAPALSDLAASLAGIDALLAAIVRKALAHDPRARFASMEELRKALEDASVEPAPTETPAGTGGAP